MFEGHHQVASTRVGAKYSGSNLAILPLPNNAKIKT
jgi:hypothetical protein